MAHDVSFSVPSRPVANKDIEFDVRKDRDAFGTLKVSEAGVVWRPRDHKFGCFLSWTKINEIFQ